jgi:FKBP-type peptidyl-prolyl cis-trans isomerase (trigger factor)
LVDIKVPESAIDQEVINLISEFTDCNIRSGSKPESFKKFSQEIFNNLKSIAVQHVKIGGIFNKFLRMKIQSLLRVIMKI